MELAKARIGQLIGKNETKDDLDVQFNPASLRLQITNSVEGAQSRGRQVRQYLGSSSTTLTCDLIFDTADEGTTGGPISVRTKTEILERFLRPKGNTGRNTPPRVRFHWGHLTFDGWWTISTSTWITSPPTAMPLRAKVTLAIKEQNPEQELNKSGAGANAGSPAAKPGQPSADSPGGGGVGPGVGGETGLRVAEY